MISPELHLALEEKLHDPENYIPMVGIQIWNIPEGELDYNPLGKVVVKKETQSYHIIRWLHEVYQLEAVSIQKKGQPLLEDGRRNFKDWSLIAVTRGSLDSFGSWSE
jgi:hypothetical protein